MAKGDSTGVSATGGGQPNGVSNTNPMEFQNWLNNYQSTHNVSEGIEPLAAEAQKKFGYGRFDYGQKGGLSNNELNVGGQKYKVMGGEGGPGAYWYKAGMDDSAPGVGPSGNWMQQMMKMFGGGMMGGKQYQQPMARRTNIRGRATNRPMQTATPIGPSGAQATGREQV